MAEHPPLALMAWFCVALRRKTENYRKTVRLVSAFGLFLTFMQTASLYYCPQRIDAFLLMVSLLMIHITMSWISLMHLMDIETMERLYQSFCWPLNSAAPNVRKRIHVRARYEETKGLIAFLLYVIAQPLCLLNLKVLREVDFTSFLLRSYLPQLETGYLVVLVGWLVVTTPIMAAFPFALYYSNWQQQFQGVLFAEKMKDIFATSPRTRYNTLNGNYHFLLPPFDTTHHHFQQIVWNKLTFLIRRHQELLRAFHHRMRFLSIKRVSFLFGFIGAFIALTACFNIIMKRQVVVSILYLIIVVVYLEMMASATQGYEDSHEAMFDSSLTLPWYEWNVKNRKAYLLLVQQCGQLVTYKFFNVRVNRAFAVKFMEKIYAAGTIFYNLT